MYMDGRLRTAARPSNTLMLSAPYSSEAVCVVFSCSLMRFISLKRQIAVFHTENGAVCGIAQQGG